MYWSLCASPKSFREQTEKFESSRQGRCHLQLFNFPGSGLNGIVEIPRWEFSIFLQRVLGYTSRAASSSSFLIRLVVVLLWRVGRVRSD
ncbi:hypothetical protein LAZ67_9001562 [Cordylochernes scorpioides]|uniref:Uncharacterized protein n=1 Tax=Cordylochernes scorpioides TaxID=51811 RepID=A0ABY6KVV5_9ARAC|nr:hypothetical protein LAZ67_9001562 [Cordylochernes scorpioides]